MGAMEALNEIDRENCSTMRKALRYASELPEDVLNVYNAFYLAINPLLKDRKDINAAFLITGVCRAHLMRGALSLFHLYTGQMFREIRGAAEAAAIAYMISRRFHGQAAVRGRSQIQQSGHAEIGPLFRTTVPGPDTGSVILMIEYPDMAAYGTRTDFENRNPAWRSLFEAQPESPETLMSVELLTEI